MNTKILIAESRSGIRFYRVEMGSVFGYRYEIADAFGNVLARPVNYSEANAYFKKIINGNSEPFYGQEWHDEL